MSTNSDREVIRCSKCKLVQYRGKREECPRCGVGFGAVPTVTPAIKATPRAKTKADWVLVGRMRLGLTQRELGLRMGVPRSYISKVESGGCEPRKQTLERFAAVLGCELTPPPAVIEKNMSIKEAVRPQGPIPALKTIAEAEREAIMAAMEFYGPQEAAKVLGIGKTKIYRKLKEYGAIASIRYILPETGKSEEIKSA